MPQIQVTCDSCGKLGFETFGERAHGPRLLTFFSFRCEHCGAAVEADGQGPLEGVYRKIDLEQNGRWRLEFEPEERAKVVQLLRPIFGLTAPEMLEAVRRGLEGSFGEIDRAVQVLRKGGLSATQIEQTKAPTLCYEGTLISFSVEMAFEVAGRGVVVPTKTSLDRIRPGVVYTATISSPDGHTVETKATRELPLRNDPTQAKMWAIMLSDTPAEAVPIGAVIKIQGDEAPKHR